jgi:dihydrofolate reductase
MVSIIAAVGKNREIGKENKLLCSLPADMKHFREYTKGKAVIMGRKTYESIGHPLPNRKNIVISRNTKYKIIGADVTDSLDVAFEIGKHVSEDVVVIGGSQVYEQALPYATEMYITHIHADFPDADSFFPEYDPELWEEKKRIHYHADEQNPFDFDIVFYQKNI